ncbi:MAG: hypothetical protein A3G32_02305 [Deltaproteobacteria bacterium RIFCSPLOWO2_12_FULL_40_28]|nr:MAG: hypothetical protein A3C45_02985 [Deltaproteobacteria bacterium RIFCSPHIGHO2_02_FULL_40_28]OGQ55254.1 MAG: hypothetical protein A3G32_02305 [Deltaproteobacteria bacterium RIFCSPLOWO2_12_FULL_40_28]
MAIILIDGYNLIRQSAQLKTFEAQSLEKGRMALLRKLSAFQKTSSHRILVFFDAAKTDNLSTEEIKIGNIGVVFSEQNQKADELMIKKTRELGSGCLVVSSDREILAAARKEGAAFLSSPEFLNQMEMKLVFESSLKADDAEIEKPLHKRWITMKKGPAKRLPKAKRRAMNQLKKS